MATVRHIDKEAYAAKALEILNGKREGYVNYALGLMKDSLSPGETDERLKEKVGSEMEDALFNYLKRSGKVSGDYRWQCYPATGFYRHVRREPQKRDVPSDLLDIKAVLPDFEKVMADIMVEAGKRRIIGQIETVAKEAKENNEDSNDL